MPTPHTRFASFYDALKDRALLNLETAIAKGLQASFPHAATRMLHRLTPGQVTRRTA